MVKNYFLLILVLFFLGNIYSQTTAIPDTNFEQALIDLSIDSDGIVNGGVATVDISGVLELNVDSKNISDLTGIEDFVSLKTLICKNNQLSSLGIHKNNKLEYLDCDNNQLGRLDVTTNTALTFLTFNYNQVYRTIDLSNNTNLIKIQGEHNNLSLLNVTQNTDLIEIILNDNQLTSIDVKNGNNTLITNFDTRNNPNLTCIQVDDAVWSQINWSNINVWNIFSENCPKTYVPDSSFEGSLVGLGLDDVMDDYVFTSNINKVEILYIMGADFSWYTIKDLTGIEDFTALKVLYLEELLSLENFSLEGNKLLEELYIDNVAPQVNNDKLTQIQVTNNTNLKILKINYNYSGIGYPILFIETLDLTQNTVLHDLDIRNTKLTSLDLSNNKELTALRCSYHDQLTYLNIKNGNNTIITDFNTLNNDSLTCIDVDDVPWSNTNWTNIESWTSFSEDCKSALDIDDELLAHGVSLYPNPVTNILTIDSEISLSKIEIYSVLGKKIKEINSGFKSIQTNKLSNGIYIVKMYSENGMTTKKLIKK